MSALGTARRRVERRRERRNIRKRQLAGAERRLAEAKAALARAKSDAEWAGSRAITNQVIDIAARHRPGARVTSRKRANVLLGNRGSDHNVFNRTADAVDLALVNDQAFMDLVSRELGGPSDVQDFQSFNVRRNGATYRVQLIAGTHGTGPHFHAGVRKV